MSKVDNDTSLAPNLLISMWVLLEGKPSSVEIHIKPSNFILQSPNLNNFKKILKQEFEAFKDVRLENIEFFSDKDRTQTRFGGVLLADLVTTDSCPLIVRYLLSTSSNVIRNFSKLSKFENAKVDDLYFEISEGNEENLENKFQFNELIDQIEEKEKRRVLPDLKVQIKNKKPYNEWDIRDVFTNILHQDYNGSLGQAFNLDELPNYNSITVEEMKFFVEKIKKMMKTAVNHIQMFTNNLAQLYVEANLYGSKRYGPVDYLVKLDDFAVLVNEAKSEDLTKRIAQNIMQLHSASESLLGKRKLEQTEFESSQQQLFGIVTTGVSWYFIHWTGSPENPKVEISRQHNCGFEEEMQSEKNVVFYIVCILENQDDMLKNNPKH
ncbi:1160_t:CDS:2, partial [Racocetra persica]